MNRPHWIFFITVLFLISSTTSVAQETTNRKIPEHLNQILKWLPVDTETLVVANGPFELPVPQNEIQPFVELTRSLSYSLVTQIHGGRLAKQLQGTKVLIAVEASRRFISPKSLGMMPFEGCQILKFDDSDHDVVQAAIESCFERASKTVQIGDTKTAVLERELGNDEWSLLVAQPQRGVLICATNQSFLEQIIERMKRENPDRALPDNLPIWGHVNFDASVWGMRHYRKDFADTDPTSPLSPQAAANVPDSLAIGLVFWFDTKGETVAKVRYLSGAKDAAQLVTQGWQNPHENLAPIIKQIEPGVIEITASFGEDDNSLNMFMFVLLAYLGHAIYL